MLVIIILCMHAAITVSVLKQPKDMVEAKNNYNSKLWIKHSFLSVCFHRAQISNSRSNVANRPQMNAVRTNYHLNSNLRSNMTTIPRQLRQKEARATRRWMRTNGTIVDISSVIVNKGIWVTLTPSRCSPSTLVKKRKSRKNRKIQSTMSRRSDPRH